ncbi:MAG: DUF4382 domain-containing protein, partial [Nitrospinae bacterium]|nr:DUF4382 domain-containing protein [Nitrospinota bacterium]
MDKLVCPCLCPCLCWRLKGYFQRKGCFMKKNRFIWVVFTALLTLSLTGCGSDEGKDISMGSLSLNITDAPVDGAISVVINFTGVGIKPAKGEELNINFDQPRHIDLLELNGGDGHSEILLNGYPLPAGHYNWIRLKVAEDPGVIELGGQK